MTVLPDNMSARTPPPGTIDNSSQGWQEVNMAADHTLPPGPPPLSSRTDFSPTHVASSASDPRLSTGECQHGSTHKVYADLKFGMDSILRQENHLQSELLDIKQQFFKLLKSSGANDASYTLSPSIRCHSAPSSGW
ncbi:uncharacterized protein LOC112559245 [Pomacea canaliculata]|uniref:uncharacterized protein LOC112559245 n=1 Tax=Pomacea canaliculata TaxID=400727 RepID=UPI000D72EA6E|nr:uncharacterized protein LOC112559245 [Pomacea canaliculata]